MGKGEQRNTMIGVIPAAGVGKRIGGSKPFKLIKGDYLIQYPLNMMLDLGIKECIIIQHEKELERMFGDMYSRHGKATNMHLKYVSQPKATGIADAVLLAEPFTKDEDICVILADIIYVGNLYKMQKFFNQFRIKNTALIAGRTLKKDEQKEVCKSYGFAIDKYPYVFIEKPKADEVENWLGYGIYMFKPYVYEAIRNTPSSGITEVLNSMNTDVISVEGEYWNINTPEELEDAREKLNGKHTM